MRKNSLRKYHIYPKLVTVFIAVMFLASCGNNPRSFRSSSGLTPEPLSISSPGNIKLKSAIKDFLKGHNAPAYSRYEFSRPDLNSDGLKDAVILMKNPYGYWCEDKGCTLIIFEAKDGNFILSGIIKPLRNPVYVSKYSTNGWRDLIVRIAGFGEKTRYVSLPFNGDKYPNSPYLPSIKETGKDSINSKLFP